MRRRRGNGWRTRGCQRKRLGVVTGAGGGESWEEKKEEEDSHKQEAHRRGRKTQEEVEGSPALLHIGT